MIMTHSRDVDVQIRTENGKAVIQGKTTVPFQTFVSLVLQRKVFSLFKSWGKEPIVLSSDLLTDLASAPQDSTENRTHLVLVTLGVGILVGIFVMAIGLAVLQTIGMPLGRTELLLIAGGIVGLALLASILGRIQHGKRGEKITEKIEKLADLFSK